MKKTGKLIISLGLCAALLSSSVVFAEDKKPVATKDETVYVMMNADGSLKKQTVSSWIHCDTGIKNVKETTNLTDIHNVKGEAKPTLSGDQLSWNMDGNDVYYQGTSTKTPPVTMKITYKLDGKEIAAKEIAGKSGKLEMTIQYTNNEKKSATINGKQKDVYTPFLVTTAIDMKTDVFQNVKCNNAKILSDGNNQIVALVAVPGLKQNMGDAYSIVKDGLGVAFEDQYVITADVKNFELTSIISAVATNFLSPDLLQAKDLNGLSAEISKVVNAVNQLNDGTTKLADALHMFNQKMNELQSKTGDFSKGIDQLAKGSADLNSGIKQYTTAINGVFSLLSGDLANGGSALSAGFAKVQTDLKNAGTETATIGQEVGTLAAQIGELAKQGKIDPGVAQSLIAQLQSIGANVKSHGDTLQTTGKDATNITTALGGLMGSINASNPQLGGLQQQLKESSNKLVAGSDALNAGMKNLSDGKAQLSGGIGQLTDASKQLADKSKELNNGTIEFKKQTIDMLGQKLGSANINELVAVKDAMVNQAKEYTSYSGQPENSESAVKFVMKTDEIKQQAAQVDTNKPKSIEKEGFFERIGNFFKDLFHKGK